MRAVLPFMVGMASGGLASQLLPLTMFPKAIAVGLIAAAAVVLATAILRLQQSSAP